MPNKPRSDYEERKQQFEHEQRYAASQDSVATWLAHLGRWRANGHRRAARFYSMHVAGRLDSTVPGR
jgi:hypothetical protein